MSLPTRPPGPRGHLLLGHFRPFRRDALGFLTRCARDHGDVAAFRLGHRRIVLLSHPDLIEQVLVADNRRFVKHFVLQLLRPVLGNGLVLSEGDFWLRQRRLMQPAFATRRIEGYAETMVEHTQRMLAGWPDGETCDLHEEMMRLALSIVSKVLLDVDTGQDARDVAASVDLLMDDFGYRLKNAFAWPAWVPTPWNRRVERAIRRLGDIVHRIIQQRRTSGEDHGDLLSLLVHARDEDDGRGMTDRQLRDEVMTMFLAGHETTANAMTWTWYLLAQHPEAEAKLLAELDTVLGGRSPTVEDLPRLDYTARVVQEAMRLYPPAYVIGREAVEPCEIGGYRFPVGTTFLMSQWVVHRDGRWYDDPEAFDPDRWTPEFIERMPKYAYFPFGGGPRVCIGNKFAEMEAALILATMAPQVSFTLEPGQDIRPWPAITLRPVEGLRASIQRSAVSARTTQLN